MVSSPEPTTTTRFSPVSCHHLANTLWLFQIAAITAIVLELLIHLDELAFNFLSFRALQSWFEIVGAIERILPFAVLLFLMYGLMRLRRYASSGVTLIWSLFNIYLIWFVLRGVAEIENLTNRAGTLLPMFLREIGTQWFIFIGLGLVSNVLGFMLAWRINERFERELVLPRTLVALLALAVGGWLTAVFANHFSALIFQWIFDPLENASDAVQMNVYVALNVFTALPFLIWVGCSIIVFSSAARKLRARARENRCPQCGYLILPGGPTGCPECGWGRNAGTGGA